MASSDSFVDTLLDPIREAFAGAKTLADSHAARVTDLDRELARTRLIVTKVQDDAEGQIGVLKDKIVQLEKAVADRQVALLAHRAAVDGLLHAREVYIFLGRDEAGLTDPEAKQRAVLVESANGTQVAAWAAAERVAAEPLPQS